MSPNESDFPWLQRKSPLLFDLLVFVGFWLGIDSTLALHKLGQPIVPRIFEALFMGLCLTLGLRFGRWKKDASNNNRNEERL